MTEYDGVERSTTERLRQILDERGVEWKALSDRQDGEYTITATRWHDGEGGLLTMCICEPDGSTWDFFWYPTPEQAVDATLGRGTCHDANVGGYFVCSECEALVKLHSIGRSYVDEWGKRWYATSNDHGFNYCPNCGKRVVEA